MTDARKIAAGLSEAQRVALLSKGYPLPSMGPAGYDTLILNFKYGRSAKALHRMGLATLAFAPSILTPLGLAMRDILKEQS